MKKSNFWKLLSGTAFFAAVALASCVDDNDDKGMPYLEVTPDVLTFNADGAPEGASAFTVKSNRPWTLEVLEGSDWVTPSATQGSGDGTVEFTIPASNVGRIAKLSFNLKNAYGAYWTKEVTIEQGEATKAGEVSALVAYIKNTWPSLESGTEELNYSQKTIPAVILANNEGGNLYQVISLVDNTGEAKSGIIIKGEDHTEKTLPVGTKVVVSLRYAEYDNYQGLPQLLKATVFATEEKAEMKVPEITDAEAADYLGQYVTVKNLTPAKDAKTWVVDGQTTTTDFTGETGETIPARVTRYAEFADEKIAQKTANLTGVMEVYKGTYQLYPTSREDVAGFSEK